MVYIVVWRVVLCRGVLWFGMTWRVKHQSAVVVELEPGGRAEVEYARPGGSRVQPRHSLAPLGWDG